MGHPGLRLSWWSKHHIAAPQRHNRSGVAPAVVRHQPLFKASIAGLGLLLRGSPNQSHIRPTARGPLLAKQVTAVCSHTPARRLAPATSFGAVSGKRYSLGAKSLQLWALGVLSASVDNCTNGRLPTATHKCCFECCIKCLGGVPYASLVATILCFSGVALFCGCGHVALAGTVAILEQHFSTNASDHALLSEVIQLMQYVIYGIASFFFLYGIILLAEGFYTTSAVKELHGEFKTTACGRCISGMFVFLTYVLGVAWLGVFGFSAVPVFMFHNIWATCEVIKSPQTNGTASVEQICVDVRQYGIIPWNAFPGRICGSALENICNTNEFYMSYHLFIVACAGAGATVIALIHFLMILSSNWAYLKDASKMQAYQDIKAKEEQELQDIQSRSKEQLNSYT
ncbi:Neuronal membrane glycoprotein M6-b [Galemys pyrenaicus]|uniref:Neuronal membrane glycoprotein M6-b n=1 Tax=Galemys pyrenaicus TaxID=202257 RepID=A0A8J6DVE9_GALPY|nr:Neuronal membrane glycoprotein M6-b [Galemys pyrenaicus]